MRANAPRRSHPSGVRDTPVFVEAPARLHFGMLDLRGSLGRRFGGIGAGVPNPSLLLEARPSDALRAEGPSADRVLEFARRFLAHHTGAAPSASWGAAFRVHRAIPPHAGLGSGTQLALATARALAELYSLPGDAATLARELGRARRSAIGTWVFAGGGFVLEGGRRDESEEPAPLLARLPFPPDWRCVIAIPTGEPGVSGEAEAAAFAGLPRPSDHDAERVAHIVLMALLPSLVEGDLVRFGRSLTEVQCITGRWFAPVQGGAFAVGTSAELVRRMGEWGAAGVGQSSWGPAVYGVIAGDRAAAELASRVRDALGNQGSVFEAPFTTGGARVWRGDSPAS